MFSMLQNSWFDLKKSNIKVLMYLSIADEQLLINGWSPLLQAPF